ncbi:UDP-N-acetylglucosamine 2-epimerase (non-hydrolyzing) [Pseudonocardiaceae bacterium YIM PH 21723]|nr:UDP-N-acetylglucosamine 2-epimerase (non-hydrolyzing) [Pseudonocardiaceae bacterium YIM PH 21723]
MDVLLMVGTRPEAVKAAPVALAMAEHPVLRPILVHSGQHPVMVDQALEPFGLKADIELGVERHTGSQAELVSEMLACLDDVLVDRQPVAVIVQGDTTTTLAGALAAFWRGIPVVHLEAGLRTNDLSKPFPEEGNRQMISRIASLHLAPTALAVRALLLERPPRPEIVLTGNTVVDAVAHIAGQNLPAISHDVAKVEALAKSTGARVALVTSHRRENWGRPLHDILESVRVLVEQTPDLLVLFPAHPNPSVREQVNAVLGGHHRIFITEPLDYPDLVRTLSFSSIVLTDSGGIQEEAPHFGVPVLVLRELTERMEAVEAGYSWLVGTEPAAILEHAHALLQNNVKLPTDKNPFGDGHAAGRTVVAVERLLGLSHVNAHELHPTTCPCNIPISPEVFQETIALHRHAS